MKKSLKKGTIKKTLNASVKHGDLIQIVQGLFVFLIIIAVLLILFFDFIYNINPKIIYFIGLIIIVVLFWFLKLFQLK